jgi:hypothetical protein
MNLICLKVPKLMLFALTGLLIATGNNFFPRDRQVLAQTTKIKQMTTQLAQINHNYPLWCS